MKKIMKKALSVMLVVAMLIVPMTAWAADGELGSYNNPYKVDTGEDRVAVTVAPESEAWVQVDDANGTVLTVGYATTADYMLMYCRQPYYPTGVDNTATLTMVDGADMFSVYNSSATASVVLYMTLAEGTPADEGGSGAWNDPATVTLEPNPRTGALGAYLQTELAAGNQGYYYTVTAPADGSFTVSMYGAYDAEYNDVGWTYSVNNETAGRYGDYHWSDDETVVQEETVVVSEGDEIVVFVATYKPNDFTNPAGTVNINIGFSEKGSQSCPEVVTEGEYTANVAAKSNGYFYKYVATEEGTLTVTMKDATGWQYVVNNLTACAYGEMHWSDDETVVTSEDINVAIGDEIVISVCTYDPNSFEAPAGTVNWTLSFEVGEVDDDDKDDDKDDDDEKDESITSTYIESTTLLTSGEKEYAVDNAYTYTIYVFKPTEVGKYTITSDDSKMGIVGYFWVEENKLTDNVVCEDTIVWNCTAVEQNLYIAVKTNADVANITIVQGEVEDKSIPVTDYVNKVKPESFTFTANADDLIYVDTFDGVVDTAVLGEDGYYHLNSADGPVLFVDLDDEWNSLAAMNDVGKLTYVVYEDGVAVSQTIYNNAFIEYYACADVDTGLYPLTEDLISIYKYVGLQNDWYSGDGFITLGDDEDAWMYACYYVEGLNTLGNMTPGGAVDGPVVDGTITDGTISGDVNADGSVQTGDNTNVVLWISVLGLGVIAVAATMVVKKKAI